jgi:hypothetical protein
MPTAAITVGAIGAAGSIGAAAIGANAQTQNAQAAVAEQNAMLQQGYSYANNQLTNAQGVLNPWITAGSNALTSYNAALPQLTAPFSAGSLPSTPGYQFTLDQGLKSTQNSYAAEGLGSSGAAEKGAASYATGLAQNTYNQQFQNYLTQNAQIGNLLYQPATLGAGAAGSLASIEGSLGGAGLGAAVGTGQGIANTLTGAGNAIAGAATGAANSLTGGLNTALQYNLLSTQLQNQNQLIQGIYGGGGANAGAYNPYTAGAFATNGPSMLNTANSYFQYG